MEDHLRNLVNTRIITRLKEILIDRIADHSKPLGDFDIPNWSQKEAFRQGRVFEAQQILNLLSFNEDRT